MDKLRRMIIFWLASEAISSPVFSTEWEGKVVHRLDALVSSCVVIPCSFTYPGEKLPNSKLGGVWHLKKDRSKIVYHEDDTNILDQFRERTKLVGHLADENCTLEIDNVKITDDGPFCFRVEIPENDTFPFVKDCAQLKIRDSPKPHLIHQKIAVEGQPYTVTCSIMHTCPSHAPRLTWSKSTGNGIGTIEFHKSNDFGSWEMQSILTFIPEKKDDHSEITCTATFHGGMTSSKTLQLFLKRKENFLHIIVPVVVGVVTAVICGALCVVMRKKYKRHIAELQNGGHGSMWNRLSRLSRRIHSGVQAPFNREQRRPQRDMGAVHMPNNMTSTTTVNQKISKARFPSPKSLPKSYSSKPVTNYNEDSDDGEADYTNVQACSSIYGNL
ncbi:myelin-associated glycoprotein [Polymixia lowei]